MGMDRNTVIGFVLIGVLLIGMFYFNSKNRLSYEGEQLRIADSIAAAQPQKDTVLLKQDSVLAQNIKNAQVPTELSADTAQQNVALENEVLKIVFSNKGAQPAQVILKKFKKYDSTQVTLQDGPFDQLYYSVNAGQNKTVQTNDLFFKSSGVVRNADGSQTLSFVTGDSTGKEITHQYVMRPNDYMVDLNISLKGTDQLFSQNILGLQWQTETPQVEKDHKYELTQTHVSFVANDKSDFESAYEPSSETFEKPVDWIGVKQQFFIAALAARNKFSSAVVEWKLPPDSSSYLLRTTVSARVPLPAGNVAAIPLQFYYGPSDYNILKNYNNKMEDMVPYGSGVFSFVKYINRYFLLPVFDFIQKHVGSMGIVILLLTLFIRLITSPILYKSYLSGAKMKVLKPEVDALKAKFTDKSGQLDQQAFSMEQMKLWRTAGVSPLGGCLPAVLQIPIFMSLFYFFQSNISLRGESFLWATDLATYDSIAKLPFEIPFYGDHVSLFTLTAVITSLAISLYSMNNMQDQSNPVMKYMPYIFPILLLGVFNKLPAALTWYYTISNLITLILQFVIQTYIIDHKKILAKINLNKQKPKKQSKFAERLASLQEQQKQMKDQRTKK